MMYEPLPNRRDSVNQTFHIYSVDKCWTLHTTVGFYSQAHIGEIFITVAKTGDTERAHLDCLARSVSIGLQHGVLMSTYLDSFVGYQCLPRGPVQGHDTIKLCSSPIDLVLRWIAIDFLDLPEYGNVKV